MRLKEFAHEFLVTGCVRLDVFAPDWRKRGWYVLQIESQEYKNGFVLEQLLQEMPELGEENVRAVWAPETMCLALDLACSQERVELVERRLREGLPDGSVVRGWEKVQREEETV